MIFEATGPDLRTILVRHVLPDTPAAAAGVREADTVVSLDGQNAQSLGLEGVRTALCCTGDYHRRLRRGEETIEIEMQGSRTR